MILKRIVVSNWRSLLGEVEVGPFSEGLNVIHAPNGTGKSSLFEAMCRGLFDAHLVTGGDIAAVQPWGRSLTPSVCVEFEEGGQIWRVEKSFLSDKSARLLRLEGGNFVPVADGRQADERIREILLADAPGRGLSKQEHWGLAQVLWAPQGELRLDKVSGKTSEILKEALGVQVAGSGSNRIEELVEERYLQFFTKKGGYKTGKDGVLLVKLQEERASLERELVDLRDKHHAFEKVSHDVEDARQRRQQARLAAEELRKILEKSRAQAEVYKNLKAEQNNKRESERLAKEKYETLLRRKQQLEETGKLILELEKSLGAKTTALAELKKEEVLLKEALAEKRAQREMARRRRGQLSDNQKLIEVARSYLRQKEELRGIMKALEQLTELLRMRDEAKEKLGKVLAPSAKALSELRKLVGKREQAAAALKASQIHLTIRPERSIEVTNITDETKTTLAAGDVWEVSGDHWVGVSIAGLGEVQASGPEESADVHREALAQAETEIRKLTLPYGTDDPDKLQELREQADRLEVEVKGLEGRIGDLITGKSLESLKQACAELQAGIAEAEKAYPEWVEHPPVLVELQANYERSNQELEGVIKAAEDACDQAQARHTAAEKKVNEETSELKLTQGRLDAAKRQQAELCSDGLSDEVREKAIGEALMSWSAAKATAEQAEDALQKFPDDPGKELSKQEKLLVTQEEEEAKARDAEKTAEGQLETLAAEGTYSKLSRAEERLTALDVMIGQESVRMDAIKLLYDTVSERRSRMLASIAAPVEQSASRMLSRIVGPRLGKLNLGMDFVPQTVTPGNSEEPVGLDNLSGGEQEQLHLVMRMALADVLSKDRRQLVVLDDVLNATDMARLSRMLSLMEEAAERQQIVILTCHPERYRALNGAEFFELRPGEGPKV